MGPKELKSLIKHGEGPRVEFKESFDPDSLGRAVCAFANSTGGTILLGVSDAGTVKGIGITNRLKSQTHDIARNMDPKLEVSVRELGGVLAVDVPQGSKKPYAYGGKFFVRHGTNSQQLGRDEIREFFRDEGLVLFDEQENASFDVEKDISPSAYRNFVSLCGISSIIRPKELLANLSLLGKAGMKNAGVLLFAKDITRFVSWATVTCVIFQGTGRVNILDRKEFSGDVYSNYEKAINYLKMNLRTRYIIEGSGPRVERLELPEEALREAVLNAIAHRNYFATTSIFVEIYSDRVEITNPGGLVRGLKKEELGTKSLPRNKLLFSLLQRMDLVEQAGTGIARIRKAMREYGLTVKFDVSEGWFSVVFPRAAQKESRLTAQKIQGTGSEIGSEKSSEKILECIKEKPDMSAGDLARKLGISSRAVEKQISKLKKDGLLKRVGPDKGGHWEVLKS